MFNFQLTKYKKISETEWEENTLLNVQFSNLIGKRPQDEEALRICKEIHLLPLSSGFHILH